MIDNEDIDQIMEKFKEELTLDGRKKFEDGTQLSSDFLKRKADPEAYTKEFLIRPILEKFDLPSIMPEKRFEWMKGVRKVDYEVKNQKGQSLLIEAKAVNSNLRKKEGAVDQIKILFELAEVKENYKFGVATDGLTWILIDRAGNVSEFRLTEDLKFIKELLSGEGMDYSIEREREKISSKFYVWYNALLNGGSYKDNQEISRKISSNDCLVGNVLSVQKLEEREQIAQVFMDRLIFIKFLQSKRIIGDDVLSHLSSLEESSLNDKLKQLFFDVLNTRKSERSDIDSKFKNIPYLNGSLFVRTEVEIKNPDYKIKSEILKKLIEFLDSFSFVHTENVSNKQMLDPEILGYIFEKAMTSRDRKGSGSFYTPKFITNYISEATIHRVILDKVNKLLKVIGYKDSELIDDVEKLPLKVKLPTLIRIFNEIMLNLKICDNACGSGAFLIAVADALLKVNKTINNELPANLKKSGIDMKKLILKNNLYGVDINPNAIEIAKLRLWLWLAASYEPDKIEPLPNIDYNIRCGNSLVGYIDISKFKNQKLSLLDYSDDEQSLNFMLKKREELIEKYKDSTGNLAKNLRDDIEKSFWKDIETFG